MPVVPGYVTRISRSTSNNINLNEPIMLVDVTARYLRNRKNIHRLIDIDDYVAPGSARLSSILAQLPTPRRVLELGCGHRSVIAAPNALHVAVDHDGRALQSAQIPAAPVQPAVALHLLQADIEHLPFRARFDLILAVQGKATDILEGALEAGMERPRLKFMRDAVQAGDLLARTLKKGDIVLVKGSRGVRLEQTINTLRAAFSSMEP